MTDVGMRLADHHLEVTCVESSHAAIAVVGIAASGLAVWWLMRRSTRNDARRDRAVPEDSVHTEAPSVAEVSDTHHVLESLRQQLREGDIAAQDSADDSISLPFLETEPRHHEVDDVPAGGEDPFEDTVPTFSWARDED